MLNINVEELPEDNEHLVAKFTVQRLAVFSACSSTAFRKCGKPMSVKRLSSSLRNTGRARGRL